MISRRSRVVMMSAVMLAACVSSRGTDTLAELQARFDREGDDVQKAKLLGKLGDAQLEAVRKASAANDFNAVGLTMEKYRDNVRAALSGLERRHPDGEKHASGYKQLQMHVRKALRDLDEILRLAPEEFQPPLQLVRKDLAGFNEELLMRLFPRRPGEKPLTTPPAGPEKKP